MRYEDLKYLEVPLPEAIAKEKWGGFFENARSRIAAYLDDETTDYALRCRLELELGILQNLQERYTLCPEEALLIMQEKIPVMTAEELEKLRMEDKADWIYINGQ
ncbi:MAG: transglutaminase domain-containing protein, partial [Clostridiales bacterium]|nr:transglutaminase domain-containing protein [Clostridiales bacterium]